MKKSICFLVHHRYGGGGISPVVQYAAQSVAALRNWRITVVFIHDPISDEIDSLSSVRYVGLNLRSIGYHHFLSWLDANPQDVIITNHVGEINHLFAYFPQEVKHIAILHHSGRRYIKQLARQCRYLDGVFTVAQHVEGRALSSLQKVGYSGILRTVHNGALFPTFKRDLSDSDEMRLLFIGGPDPFKGIHDTLPLLINLRQVGVAAHLTIVGGIDEHLQRSFKKAGLADSVTWTGWVPHERCYDFAAQADVFLMLSRKEPFGMVTIEAMAMGAVPVAYDVESGNREIIDTWNTGILVKLGDINALSNAIAKLQQDKVLWARLSKNAVENVRHQFGAAAFGSRVIDAIEEVISSAKPQSSLRLKGNAPRIKPTVVKSMPFYRQMPPELRRTLRRWIGMRARLCHFLLDKYY